MMTLWFEDRYGESRQVAKCNSNEEVYSKINEFIEQANARKRKGTPPFKSHYVRSWEQDGKKWYDVGSWSEFFYTEEN